MAKMVSLPSPFVPMPNQRSLTVPFLSTLVQLLTAGDEEHFAGKIGNIRGGVEGRHDAESMISQSRSELLSRGIWKVYEEVQCTETPAMPEGREGVKCAQS